MIGHKNDGRAFWNTFPILNFIIRSQNMTNSQQDKVQIIDAFFMGLIPKNFETNPLGGMKYN
jgi:hypothetical protein